MVTGGEEKRLYRDWRVGGTNTTRCKIGYKDVLYNMGNLKNYIEKFKKNPFSFLEKRQDAFLLKATSYKVC